MALADPVLPASRARVAIVDDDRDVRELMGLWLQGLGYVPVSFASGAAAVAGVDGGVEAICLDRSLGDADGLDVLKHLRARLPDVPVVMVTASRDVEAAVVAMQSGAYDYVVKPFDQARLGHTIGRAVERCRLVRTVQRLAGELGERHAADTILGRNPAIVELVRELVRVADRDVTVCVTGESGTGKELVARAIHQGSRRARGPFVAINCAAIPASLLESELFGHERGAFTGAVAAHRGRFEQAHGGTIFLDEIGEMSPAVQAALLRTLQDHRVRRVGGTTEIPVDCRVVSATHRDLEAEVRAGRFRQDLFFRLVVYPLRVPALRDRRDDIPLLAEHFLRRHREGGVPPRVSADALEALTRHAWPGNVRELENVVQRALLACGEGDVVDLGHLPLELRSIGAPLASPIAPPADHGPTPVVPMRELERRAIAQALEACEGNVTRAARQLGIGRSTLYRRLAVLGLIAADGTTPPPPDPSSQTA